MNHNTYRIPLLTTSMMTPNERARGRFLRDGEGHEPPPQGGGTPVDSTSMANNTGGNPADSGTPGEGGDNSGQPLDLAKFWDGKPEAPVDNSVEEAQLSQQLGTQLKGMIDGFTAPAPVFTKEHAEQIAEGNFDSINEAMQTTHRAAIQQAVVASANLIKQVVSRLQSDFDTRINSAFGNKDNSDFLKSQFPQAKNPALAPMVERVWNQALTNSKGDRTQAITLTRGMLSAMGTEFAPDDVRQPPQDPTAGINTAASRSLVDSLLDRGQG